AALFPSTPAMVTDTPVLRPWLGDVITMGPALLAPVIEPPMKAVSLRPLPILGAGIWRAFPGDPLGLGANVATPAFGSMEAVFESWPSANLIDVPHEFLAVIATLPVMRAFKASGSVTWLLNLSSTCTTMPGQDSQFREL